MLKSYLKTAICFLLKNKTFSFINIFGLAAGTLCCLYILLYVEDQYSYDKHEEHAADIYRVITDMKLLGVTHNMSTVSPPVAPTMKKDFAEVQQYTRVFNATMFGADQHLLKYKDKSFYEKQALFVDSTFFDIFSYHFLRGNPLDALVQPYSIVLLKATADKLFGTADPIGKVITINNKAGVENLTVTGIVDESLGKSHIQANAFITMNSGLIGRIVRSNDSWAGNNYTYSYIKLSPGTDAKAFEKKLPAFINRYGAQQMKAAGMEKQQALQPINTIHTTAGLEVELSKTVSPSFLNILILIAILIQVMACINFMNLSTARASKRAKEVGVRKVIGAGRQQLTWQFLGESLLLSLAGVLLALPLLWLALPYLNQLTSANTSLALFKDYRLWLILAGLVITTALLAGSYPAFYLSAFRATRVLKGNFTSHISASAIRRSLVVFQFVLSIILILGIIVIYSQLNYIKQKDLGFDKNQKLVFSFYTGGARLDELAAVLRQMPEVKAASRANNHLGRKVLQDWSIYMDANGSNATGTDVQVMVSDKYFAQTSGIALVGGRDFHDFDSAKVLINETLAKALHIDPANAETKKLYSQNGKDVVTLEIAGVLKDFNFSSLHDAIKPLMVICYPNSPSMCDITVNCTSTDYKKLLSKIKTLWPTYAPDAPFEYTFVDEEVQQQYQAEITLSLVINSFALMAVIISCLGLFGLAAFSAEQRGKEIGIRKVLGASVPGLIQLLSKDFVRLVVIAFVIAAPIAWWAMHQWLQGFAYKVTIRWWMFAAAGAMAMIIALLTTCFQAIKAAVANPIAALKTAP